MKTNWPKDERVRGATLQKIRREHFQEHPLCVRCLAKTPSVTRAAVELDHIKSLGQGGTDTPDNRQGLCVDCHLEKSKTERGQAYREKVKFDRNGWPITVK